MTRALAVAQTIPVPGDVEANLAQHLRLARRAAAAGAGVVVFPELSLTGYELDLAAALAFTERDPRLEPLRALASALDLVLVAGAPARIDSRLFIGAYILSPGGGIDLYTKHHLGAFSPNDSPGGSVPPAESSVFEAGTRNPLIRIGDRSAAIAVCADTGRASHAQAAADRGADVYLASMFVIPADLERDTARLQSYATQHAMAVAFSNYGGPSGGLPSGGCSAVWSPSGTLIGQLGSAGAGLVVATPCDDGWRAELVAG